MEDFYRSHDQIDASHKFVVVLKAKLPPGVALNAAAHLSLALTARAAREHPELLPAMSFMSYVDADGGVHAPVSALSLVVLTGRGSWLRTFRQDLVEAGLLFTDFTAEMTGDTYVEQLERMRSVRAEELDYYGVGAFGPRELLDPLTKKFSLYH
jgi:hypothetical protein